MALADLLAAYIAFTFDQAPAVNKHMITILNRNSAQIVRIWRANMYVSSQVAVAGVLLKARCLRITSLVALSGGVAITPVEMDTNDPLPASIDARTGPTNVITVVGEFKRFLMSSDEAVVTTLDADAYAAELFPRDTAALLKFDLPLAKPLTLRTDGTTFQGFSIQNLVGAVGNIGLETLFTVSAT